MDFGENLKRIRKSRGLTQAELGKAVGKSHASVSRWESGVSRAAIAKYESEERVPSTDTIQAIADVLGCTVGELFGERPKIVYKNSPKEGKWVILQLGQLGDAWTVQCSECRAIGFHGKTPFCPECGAKME